MRLKDHKRHEIKAGKVKATVYGSLNRSSCQTTTILAQNTRLSTPSAFRVETRLDDGHLNAFSIVRELHLDGKFMKIMKCFGLTYEKLILSAG